MKKNCTEKCTEALHWDENRLGLWEVEIDDKKVSFYINKDKSYGFGYLKDGKCYAEIHQINKLL